MGIILVFILLFALLTGFVLLLFPVVVEQGASLATAVPGAHQSLREWMVNTPSPSRPFSPAARQLGQGEGNGRI